MLNASIQGTQITMESVFLNRFTMNSIAPKLQKCLTQKIVPKIISKMLKQPSFFYSQPSTLAKFYDNFCSLYPIVDFLRMFNHQNRRL